MPPPLAFRLMPVAARLKFFQAPLPGHRFIGSVRLYATSARLRAARAAIVLCVACRPVLAVQRRHNIFALHAGHEDGRCKE